MFTLKKFTSNLVYNDKPFWTILCPRIRESKPGGKLNSHQTYPLRHRSTSITWQPDRIISAKKNDNSLTSGFYSMKRSVPNLPLSVQGQSQNTMRARWFTQWGDMQWMRIKIMKIVSKSRIKIFKITTAHNHDNLPKCTLLPLPYQGYPYVTPEMASKMRFLIFKNIKWIRSVDYLRSFRTLQNDNHIFVFSELLTSTTLCKWLKR